MIERGASLPMGDRVERGPGRVLRTAARVSAQGSWGTLVVWKEPGRAGLRQVRARSDPVCPGEVEPWAVVRGPVPTEPEPGPSRGEEPMGVRGSV